MKTTINSIIQLADSLDNLGLQKDVNILDQLVAKVADYENEEFSYSFPLIAIEYDVEKMSPDKLRELSITCAEEMDKRKSLFPDDTLMDLADDKKDMAIPVLSRLTQVPEASEILAPILNESDLSEKSNKLPGQDDLSALEDDLMKLKKIIDKNDESESFEDENEADDSLIDELKEILKGSPDLAVKLLTLVKDNPELLKLLAL